MTAYGFLDVRVTLPLVASEDHDEVFQRLIEIVAWEFPSADFHADPPPTTLPGAVDAFLASYGSDGVRALMEAFLRQNEWTLRNDGWWHDDSTTFRKYLSDALEVELARKERV